MCVKRAIHTHTYTHTHTHIHMHTHRHTLILMLITDVHCRKLIIMNRERGGVGLGGQISYSNVPVFYITHKIQDISHNKNSVQ